MDKTYIESIYIESILRHHRHVDQGERSEQRKLLAYNMLITKSTVAVFNIFAYV